MTGLWTTAAAFQIHGARDISEYPRMPMSEIMKLRTIDYPRRTVRHLVDYRDQADHKYPGDVEILRRDLAEHGQRTPIGVQGNTLINGGNRVWHAHNLGWPDMAVTHNAGESDGGNWDIDNYKHEVRPGWKVHPAHAIPEDFDEGRVLEIPDHHPEKCGGGKCQVHQDWDKYSGE